MFGPDEAPDWRRGVYLTLSVDPLLHVERRLDVADENQLGVIELGKKAGLVELEDMPVSCDRDRVLDIGVIKTMLDEIVVHGVL